MSEWWEDPDVAEWQHGMCSTYALALLDLHPHLRLGTLNDGSHFFAHDDEYAYDSLGRHPLPYRGVDNNADCSLDQTPEDWFGSERFGENGGVEDFARAKTLIPRQHAWLVNKGGTA